MAIGLGKSRQVKASGPTTGNPGTQAIGSWAGQVWASLSKWVGPKNLTRNLLAAGLSRSLGKWADYSKFWETSYSELG